MAVAAATNAITTLAVVKDFLAIGTATTTYDDFIQTWINNISSEMEGVNGIDNKIALQVLSNEIYNGNGRSKFRPNYYPILGIGPYTPANTAIAQTSSTITRETGSFITDGWEVGDTGVIADSGSNNGATFTLTAVAALTLTVSETLTAQTKAQTVSCVLSPSTATKLASVQFRDDVDSAWENIEDDLDYIVFNNPFLSRLSDQSSYNIELLEEVFPSGDRNIRLTYQAGWSTVPGDLTMVCVEKVADLYKKSYRGEGRFGLQNTSRSEGGGSRSLQYIDFTERHQKMMAPYKRRM